MSISIYNIKSISIYTYIYAHSYLDICFLYEKTFSIFFSSIGLIQTGPAIVKTKYEIDSNLKQNKSDLQ